MAVKTNFTFNQVKAILSNYDFGELVDFSPITKGTVQTNYLLMTTTHKLVFRYYENRTKESVLFEVGLLNDLQSKSYPCPVPICNKNGHFVGIYGEKPYVLFHFIEGEHVENPTINQKKQLIQKVAELHKITEGYQSDFIPYRLNYSLEQFERLAREKAEKLQLEEKLKWYIEQLNRLILPRSLPMGICHGDFHFSNVLYDKGECKALIDFDDANYTFLAFDLVTMINPFIFDWDTWSQFEPSDDVFDFGNAKEIISEYSKTRQLNQSEKQHLYDLLKFAILIDCIWYFERGHANDFFEKRKIDYLDRLGRDRFYHEIF